MGALLRIRELAEKAEERLTCKAYELFPPWDMDGAWRWKPRWYPSLLLHRLASRCEDVVALTHLAEQRGENADDLNDEVARAFYVAKAAVALALGRRRVVRALGDDYALAFWDQHTTYSDCGTGEGWTEIRVPAGFRHWVVDVTTESSI